MKPLRALSIRVLPVILAMALFAMVPRAALAAYNFGRTTIGTLPSAGLSGDFKRGSKFSVTERGSLQDFCAYLDGYGGVSGSQTVRYVLYKDANGVPGQKIAEAGPIVITNNTTPSWQCAWGGVAPVNVGDYWLVIHTGSQAGIVRDYADGTGNWYGNADTFSDGASDPFGSGNAGNGTLSISATFTPATEVDFAGRLDVAKIPSRGLAADTKRGSQVTFTQSGWIDSMSAYLDTLGGGSTTQDLRLVLYTDVNGKPGTKVLESDTGHMIPGIAAHWVTPITSPVKINAGRYWLMLHTGNTAGVLRDYGDGPANFFSNADTFADGASETAGPGNTGTVTLSAYVSYLPGPFYTKAFGRTTVAGTPSAGMTANFKRASFAFMRDETAVLTGLYAYLDGRGGASGSQQLRMALYQNTYNDKPGSKLVESEVVTIAAGTAPGWVRFAVPPIRLQEFYGYWIALQSGPTGGVVRNYGDGAASWFGNADNFADGAASTFGTASSGTVTMSMYGEFSTKHP
jgi:hypothetical protein